MPLPGRACAVAVLACVMAACTPSLHLSLIVRGGTVVPGDGRDGFRADVGVAGDRIVAVGDLSGQSAPLEISAAGRVVAPGFVDLQGPSASTALVDPLAEAYLRQGITTQVFGADNPAYWTAQTTDAARVRCHGGPIDWQGLAGYIDRLGGRGPAFNVAMLTPLSAARASGGDVATFIDAELQKGSFGVVATSGDAPADAAAAAGPVKRALGVMDVSWDLVAANDQAWMAVIPLAGRVIIGRSWASATPVATVYEQRLPQASLLYAPVSPHTTSDANLHEAARLRQRLLFTSAGNSDTCGVPPAGARGAFPALLRRAVQNPQTLSLGAAVTEATVLPARQAGIFRRGLILKDFFADLVIFDPTRVGEAPDSPAGIDYVIVNGVVTVTPQGLTGARAGTVLRHRPGEPLYEPW